VHAWVPRMGATYRNVAWVPRSHLLICMGASMGGMGATYRIVELCMGATHGCHVHTSTLVDSSPGFGTTGNFVNVYVAPILAPIYPVFSDQRFSLEHSGSDRQADQDFGTREV
jgi:hypothetical protein